jgi:Restriction endonuclease
MRELQAEGRLTFVRRRSVHDLPRLKRYVSEVQAPDSTAQPHDPSTIVTLILRPAMQKLARAVADNPDCLRYMEWRDLERMLREVFEELGFNTELTRSSKDGGFDLRLIDGHTVFLVEVKHWVNSNKKPGCNEVNALFDIVVRSSELTTGVLLSSSGFTQQAVHGRTEVQQRRVRLGGEKKLISLCQDYVVGPAKSTPQHQLAD